MSPSIEQHPWLDSVPTDWRVARLKTTIAFSQNGLWGEEPDSINDIVCVRVADFDRVRRQVVLNEPTIRSVPAAKIGRRLLKRGDLLLEKSGGGEHQPVGTVVKYDHDTRAVCSNFVARIEPKPEYAASFLCYLHEALYELRVPHRSIKQTTGIQNLDADSYFNEPVPLPPPAIQHHLTAFLDRKTSAIDALIAKKERLIDLLQEKRQALITQAVTKGLDPNVPMKDSGVEWLGTMPAHWKTVRVSYVADVCNGSTPDRNRGDYWNEGSVPWLSSGKVNDYVVKEADEFITEHALRESSVRLLPQGTILVGMIGQGKTRGMSAQMMLSACINQNVAGVVPRPTVDGRFLHHVFVTAYKPLREFGRGGQQDALNCDILKAFRIPLPPIDEQRRISRFLDQSRDKSSSVCDLIERHIEKLREYRQALITAAVTGKIDVSKEAA
jgi:type I restriction enzyme S subunit